MFRKKKHINIGVQCYRLAIQWIKVPAAKIIDLFDSPLFCTLFFLLLLSSFLLLKVNAVRRAFDFDKKKKTDCRFYIIWNPHARTTSFIWTFMCYAYAMPHRMIEGDSESNGGYPFCLQFVLAMKKFLLFGDGLLRKTQATLCCCRI